MEETIELSPIDQVMPRAYVRWNLHFTPPVQNSALAAAQLEKSFQQLLREIAILGSFKRQCEDSKLELKVVPQHPNYRFHIRDFANEANVAAEDLVPFPAAPTGTADAPVFAAQANIVRDGVILCFCMSHAVADAIGMTTILDRWSKIRRNVTDGTTFEPLPKEAFDCSPLRDGGIRNDAMMTKCEEALKARATDVLPLGGTVPNLPVKIFSLNTKRIADLKRDITNQINETWHTGGWVSTHDVMCAVIWHSWARAFSHGQELTDDADSRLLLAVNMRSKMKPPLPAEYIGNVNLHPAINRKIIDLVSDSTAELALTALAIRKGIISIDDAHTRGLIRLINNSGPNLPKLMNCAEDFEVFRDSDFDITSWLDLGFEDMNWGSALGLVQKMRKVVLPGVGYGCRCALMPRTQSGEVEVMIGLKGEYMGRLVLDSLFRRYAELSEILN